MGNKRPKPEARSPKPEEIVSKLRPFEVLMVQDMPRLDAIRQICVLKQTYYLWRKHGALLHHWFKRQWRRVEYLENRTGSFQDRPNPPDTGTEHLVAPTPIRGYTRSYTKGRTNSPPAD